MATFDEEPRKINNRPQNTGAGSIVRIDLFPLASGAFSFQGSPLDLSYGAGSLSQEERVCCPRRATW